MKVPARVLLVCTANQCRSAAADCFLRRKVSERRLDVRIASAGTDAWSGQQALSDTVEALSQMGYDLTPHSSQPVSLELMDNADLVLAMTHGHATRLIHLHPKVARKVFLFKPYCEGRLKEATVTTCTPSDDVQDAAGHPLEVHRQVAEQLELLCSRLVNQWQEQTVKRGWW